MPGTTPDLPTVIGDLDMQLLGLLGHTAVLTGHDLVVLGQLRTTIGRVLDEAGPRRDPADPAVAVAVLRDLTRVVIYGDGSGLEDVAIDRCDRMSGALATIDAWLGTAAADARQALNRLEQTARGDSNDDEIEAGQDCAEQLANLLAALGHPVTVEDQ